MDTLPPECLNIVCYFLTGAQFDYDPAHRGVAWPLYREPHPRYKGEYADGMFLADYGVVVWRRLRKAFRALHALSQVSTTVRAAMRWRPLGRACVETEKAGPTRFYPCYALPVWSYDRHTNIELDFRPVPPAISDRFFFLACLRAFGHVYRWDRQPYDALIFEPLRRAWEEAEARETGEPARKRQRTIKKPIY